MSITDMSAAQIKADMVITRVQLADVKRGTLLVGWAGKVVADTLSADDDGKPFWYDRSSGRHYGNGDGTINVYVSPVRTQAIGQTRSGVKHALLNAVPGELPAGVCGPSRRAELAVWESGTALAGVTCDNCRSILGLMHTIGTERGGN